MSSDFARENIVKKPKEQDASLATSFWSDFDAITEVSVRDGQHIIKTVVLPSCCIRSDSQTTGLTLTTGVPYSCSNGRGANNMNIYYDVTSLLTVVWRSHSGQIVWVF